MSNQKYYELLMECNAANNQQAFRFWLSAKNPLPIKGFLNDSPVATYTLDYRTIDDLMLLVDIIPINLDVLRSFNLAAFLPVSVIAEIMPELSMNGANLTQRNTIYYRFDGKNANGIVPSVSLPMGGGGYGSISTATVNSLAKAVWLSNYGSDIPIDELNPQKHQAGFFFKDGIFQDYANSGVSKIFDSTLPNTYSGWNAQKFYDNREAWFEHMADTYNLEWYEYMLSTKWGRFKDPIKKQLCLDNLLICYCIASYNLYSSAYYTVVATPQLFSVSPLNIPANYRVWNARIGYTSDTTNFMAFAGNNIPAYAHFKPTSYAQWGSSNKITELRLDFKGGNAYQLPTTQANDEDKLYRYLCNFKTGWTGASDNVNPNLNAEYIIRSAYSKDFQQVTGDIDFKSAITCPDSYASKSIVNLGLARKEIANVSILNLDFPGVIP